MFHKTRNDIQDIDWRRLLLAVSIFFLADARDCISKNLREIFVEYLGIERVINNE